MDKAVNHKISRRELLAVGAGVTVGGAAAMRHLVAQTPLTPNTTASAQPLATQAMPTRTLGKTGQVVPVFGLGGASAHTPLSNGPREAGVAIVERALQLGVKYFDSGYTYGNGLSESTIGEVAKTHRKEMFLASKSDQRTYDSAMRELEETLKRLQTDHLDLWQMHRASLPDRDTNPFFGPNGAAKALEKAKEQKMVRFVGVTGHHRSDVLAEWLRRFPFDTLLTTVNAIDMHHDDPMIRNLLPVALEKKVGVIAMKVPAYGRLINPQAGVTIRDAMHYSLSQPGVACCIIACDSIQQLEENVAAARTITDHMPEAAQRELEGKTAAYWQRAAFYRRWT
jgi:aryl-alcohol dehydrogenase-like predicted oxidoreductase